MKLSDRMEKIINICGKQETWADIGCDHGRVSCELVLRGKAKNVIASDISELSLYKAKDLSSSLGLTDKIECRQGDGLKVLGVLEVQGALLAGMGTPLMQKIISESMDVAAALSEMVLSPNNYPSRLRRWLIDNGFDIISEVVAKDDLRFYPIIKVKRAKAEKLSEKEAYCGRNVLRDNIYNEYIEWLLAREERIILSILEGKNQATKHEKLRELYKEVRYGN